MKEQQLLLLLLRYISEAIKKVLINPPCMRVYVIYESVNKGKRVT